MATTANTLYEQLCTLENLNKAFEKARKHKTQKPYIIKFEEHLTENLITLRQELLNKTYRPKPLETFIIRDPKTRKISKSDFRDRIIHHAICNIIEPPLDKQFIHDNYANRKGKGTLNAIKRFNQFKRQTSRNYTRTCYVLKADVKHYFDTVDHAILLSILRRTIHDEDVLSLIQNILKNHNTTENGKGMPLGNLTSQFFANVYLNELDQYVKHHLKATYYIRYVDDFVILNNSKYILEEQIHKIDGFLRQRLALELHPDKSKILVLPQGIGFLGFRIFENHQLLRKKNMKKFERKLKTLKQEYDKGTIQREEVAAALQGWIAYASHADTYKYRRHILRTFNRLFEKKPAQQLNIPQKEKLTRLAKDAKNAEQQFTVQKTLLLFNKGMNVEQIAKQRSIKPATVWEHLANLIEHHQLNINKVLTKEKTRAILQHIQHEGEKLSSIKSRITDTAITYDEIMCALAHYKTRNKKSTIQKLVQSFQRTNCERKCLMNPNQMQVCALKFEQLIEANPTLQMKRQEFLDFFNNHLTICVLPEHQKRQHVTWREYLIKRRIYKKHLMQIGTTSK